MDDALTCIYTYMYEQYMSVKLDKGVSYLKAVIYKFVSNC